MLTSIPGFEARLRAQETMSTIIHARIHEIERDKATKTDVAEIKDEITQLKGQMEGQIGALYTEVKGFQHAVDGRFEHGDECFERICKVLADIKADTADIRNMLATLIERQEQQK